MPRAGLRRSASRGRMATAHQVGQPADADPDRPHKGHGIDRPANDPAAARFTTGIAHGISVTSAIAAAIIHLMIATGPASAQAPLAASDWLEQGAARPPARESSGWRPGLPLPPDAARQRSGPDAARPRSRPEALPDAGPIGVSRLDGPDPDAAGLVPPEEAGLPADFWADAELDAVIDALAGPPPRLPVLDRAYRLVLTAQLAPPARGDGREGRLILARLDALMAMGAVDQVAALLDAAGATTAPLFARRMDAALLLGDERRTCTTVLDHPGLAPSLAARIYCLARNGDWPAAQLALSGARIHGGIDEAMLPLIAAFLDDAQVDDGTRLPPPEPMTPLGFRLLEAVGQPLPTTALPIPYAMADLRSNTGWKPRIEAAERLARAGNMAPRHLRAIYSEQPPAASGGVWDRVAAIQQLEAALSQGDPAGIRAALIPADAAMRAGGLWPQFAQIFGPVLAEHAADIASGAESGPHAANIAAERVEALALASADPEAWAALSEQVMPDDPAARWLHALAGDGPLPDQGAPEDALGAALAGALQGPATPPPAPQGLAYLAALRDLDAGREGDLHRAAQGVMVLRGLGQENLARDAVLQLILTPASHGAE